MTNRTLTDTATITQDTGTAGQVKLNIPASAALTTPNIGAATATSVNKVAITAPATSSTITVADGKTFTCSNTLTIAGTDSQVFTFPAASDSVGCLGTAQTWTAAQTFSDSLKAQNTHGGSVALSVLEDTVTLSGATTESNISIPTGSIVFGCSARVTTEITGSGVTSWSLGYSGTANAFGSTLALAAGSTNVGNTGGNGFYAATKLLFTPAGGSFAGGVVRVSLYYLMPSVPTS